MTRTTTQFRAVFLATLMVLSVFAGTVAFAGSAAAAEAPSIDTLDPSTIDEGETVTHDVEISVTGIESNNENDTISVEVPQEVTIDDSDLTLDNGSDVTGVAAVSSDDQSITLDFKGNGDYTVTGTVTLTADSDLSEDVEGDVTASVTDSADGEAKSSTKTLTIKDTGKEGKPRLESAVHYNPGSDSVIEVAFSEKLDASTLEDMKLYVDDEEYTDYDDIAQTSAGRVEIQGMGDLITQEIKLYVPDSVTDTTGDSVRSNELDDDRNYSVTVASQTIAPKDGSEDNRQRVYEGENLALFDKDAGTDYNIEIEGEDSFSGSTGVNSKVFVYNTSDVSGDLNLTIGDVTSPNAYLEIEDLGFNVTADDLNVTNEDTLEGTVSANAGNRDIELVLYDEDDDEINSTAARLGGQGEYDYEFNLSSADDGDKVSADDYYIEARDNESGVTDETDTIVVTKAGEGKANFNESIITDQRGDVVNITVDMENTDTATVTVGSDDLGFLANVTVVDDSGDGQATLQFNTWQATSAPEGKQGDNNLGSSNDVFDVADGDDEIEYANVNITVDTLLEAGEYEVEVRPGDDYTEDSTNIATLELRERNTTMLKSWTAPSGKDFEDMDDVNDYLDDGNLTSTEKVADGDTVVYQLVASGLEGALDAQGADNVNDEFFDNNRFGKHDGDDDGSLEQGLYTLKVNQTEPGANQDAWGLALNESNTEVIADGDNDTYYIVFDTDDVDTYYPGDGLAEDDDRFNTSDEAGPDFDDEDGFTANFTVYDDSDNLSDGDQTVLASSDITTAEHDMADPYNVTANANRTITGTTNVAPGTELQLRIKSGDNTKPSFLKTATVYVTENRTYSAEFDFSEQEVNDTYEIKTTGSNNADDLTVDGYVKESVETKTPIQTETETETQTQTQTQTETETQTQTQTETQTETETGGSGSTETQTETSTSTPGFGVVVAVTALLAAAFLAVRRD
jgi:surface glycoprotein (TIGR04207 family)/PGF-CTERM protein